MKTLLLTVTVLVGSVYAQTAEPLRIAMGDPLSKQLACDCVKGYAQRDYAVLSALLSAELNRPVELVTATTINAAKALLNGKEPDLIIGKTSPNRHFTCLAQLTDRKGHTTLQGCFIVPSKSPADKLEDVAGWQVILGPAVQDEKSKLAVAALQKAGYPAPANPVIAESCMQAARLLLDAKDGKTVAVISDYAWPLIAACGAAEEGELKIIGHTQPTDFIGVFAVNLPLTEFARIREALKKISESSKLREALETKEGFVLPPLAVPTVLWRKPLNHQSLGGLDGGGGVVLCSDKTPDASNDLWRCVEVATGRERWRVTYPASNEMDYTGAPRAAPVLLSDGGIILLSAWGHLCCVNSDGSMRWQQQLPGKCPTWGYCGTPIVRDRHVVVQTGETNAALAVYDTRDGKQFFATPGGAPCYGSLILARVGGGEQIIGHEARNLCGWDAVTYRKLWHITPPHDYDFNVPTPLLISNRLLVATEHNKVRLYAFNARGELIAEPVLSHEAIAPQMTSPAALNGLLFLQDDEALSVLDDALQLRCTLPLPPGCDYTNFIPFEGTLLALLKTGRLLIFQVNPLTVARELQILPSLNAGEPTEFWSKPYLSGRTLVLRTQNELLALTLPLK